VDRQGHGVRSDGLRLHGLQARCRQAGYVKALVALLLLGLVGRLFVGVICSAIRWIVAGFRD
jgi:hypothetical protein